MPQLANNESRGFTHYFRIAAAELVSGGTAARTVAQVPRGGIVTNACVTVITPTGLPAMDFTSRIFLASAAASISLRFSKLSTNLRPEQSSRTRAALISSLANISKKGERDFTLPPQL